MAKPRNSRAKYQRTKNNNANNISASSGVGATPSKTAPAGVRTISDQERYGYIASDLRNIAILAGILIVVLFVLTLFIK